MMRLQSVLDAVPPIHREGWPFIAVTLALALLFALLLPPLFWVLLALAGWMALFFRDPVRTIPVAPGLVVSPADGRVEPVVEALPPAELGMGGIALTRVSIFMNVFDCHINRAPVAGRVRRIAYRPGRFVSADLDKASEDNERNSMLIASDAGPDVAVVQIAGLVARRILCWTEEGAALSAGSRIGMIRFGSRLDVYLPAGSTVLVNAGQRAVAGETVIALLPGATLSAPPLPRAD